MNGYEGQFKGVYHVYEDKGKRYIEEFFFDSFENNMPSKNFKRTISEEFHDSDYEHIILELEEIENNKSTEFYFEILGHLTIEFVQGSWEYPNEIDSIINIENHKISLLDEKIALALGGFDDIREVSELRTL